MLQSMRSAAKYIWWLLIIAFVGSFLLYETSGLAGRAPVTTTTVVATVNGEDILYTQWQNAVTTLEQQEQQRLGRGLTLDERRTLEDNAFDELVAEILLRQEYARRGIGVTDEEILQAARFEPPAQAMQNPDLLTDGQFDIEKYQRLLSSPMARQTGMLAGLEAYYRVELPRRKLFEQLASDVYVSDERLWQLFRDRSDSAEVSFAVIGPDAVTDTASGVSDDEIRSWYDRNRDRFERPARAVVSLLAVSRTVTAADSAEALARIQRLRAEIAGGADFAAVARRESMDSVSGAEGGALGKGPRGRFTPTFETAAYALRVGELSEPVLTPFGWHLIKLDGRSGDTLDLRHILVMVAQGDSSATRTDRRADSLASIAGSATEGARLDSAARVLGLTPATVVAIDKEPLTYAGRYVPSVSAWAFSGVQVGETSDLFDAPEAYYVARLDSLTPGGIQPLADVREEIRRRLARDKRVERLMPLGEQLVRSARASTLEVAAQAAQRVLERSAAFTRADAVPGLGQYTEAIGAAFSVPVGQVAGPFRLADGVAVLRVERRVSADRAAFESQKAGQRDAVTQELQQQRIQGFLGELKRRASITDNRAKVNAQLRRQSDV